MDDSSGVLSVRQKPNGKFFIYWRDGGRWKQLDTGASKQERAFQVLFDWLAVRLAVPVTRARSPDANPEDDRNYISDEEAAKRLGCPASRIVRLRLAGKLPFLPGRPPSIDPRDLERYRDAEIAKTRAKLKAKLDAHYVKDRELSVEEIRERMVKKAIRREARAAEKARVRAISGRS